LWVYIGALGHKFQRRVIALLGLDEMLDDPRIAQDPDRLFTPDNCVWVRDRMEIAFAAKDRAHWLAALEEADVPSSPLLERSEWFGHEHVRAMGLRAELSHPVLGELLQVASPIRLSATPAREVTLPPDPGADQVLLDEITSAASAVPPAPSATVVPATVVPAGAGPLAGTRVLSLGAYVAGPQSARMLGLLGADVIKVENPAGDPWRMHGFQVNLGMRGLALDVTDPAGRAAFYELVKSADVVLDNFRPGVLERLGLDDASLRELNPAVITGSVTGFGAVGPMARRPGFDPVLQAISGMQIAQGGDDEPVMLSFAVNDTGTAALTALGVTIALFHRARTGQGQRVETSLAATSLFLQGGELAAAPGQPPAGTGGRDFRGQDPWHRYYQCTDGWIRVEGEPVSFPLEDLAGMAVDAARAALAGTGVRTMRVYNAQDLVADPVLMRMGLAYRQQNEDGYVFYTPGQMALFSRTARSGPERPPGVGEHSTEVLREAGLPAEVINELLAAKVAVQGRPVRPRVLTAYR
ncbi:MAG: CoA transferase, partial [Trebonia sp.]